MKTLLNILIYTEADLYEIQANHDIGIEFTIIPIPEMVPGCYSLSITEYDWMYLDDLISVDQYNTEVIGEWNKYSGKPKKDGKVKNKFKKAKYNKYLKDVPTKFDENGIPTKWGKPKDLLEVNTFIGWGFRDVSTDV